MRELTASNVAVSYNEQIVIRREPGELKHLITRRKRKQKAIPKVVASEIGRAQTNCRNTIWVRTYDKVIIRVSGRLLESNMKQGKSPVHENSG